MRQHSHVLPILAALLSAALFLSALFSQQGLASMAPPGSRGSEAGRLISQESGHWTVPLQLSDGSASAARPTLAIDRAKGIMHLAWEEKACVRYAYRDSTGWHTDSNPLPGDSPALAIDQEGVAHLVYVDPGGDIRHTSRGPLGWSPPANVSCTNSQSIGPALALTAQGIHVVWTEQIDDEYALYHAQSLDHGLNWFVMQPVPQAAGYAVALAATPEGHLQAAWQYRAPEDGVIRIYDAEYDGVSWGQPVMVSLGLDGEARDPNLGIDSGGRAHLVWEQDTKDGVSNVYYAHHSGGAWAAPAALSPVDGASRYPCLAVGPSSDVHVAWNNGETLVHRRYNKGFWEQPEPVTTGQDSIRQATLAVSAGGIVSIAWSARGDTGVWSIYFSERSPYDASTPTALPTMTPAAPTLSASSTPGMKPSPTRFAAYRNLVSSVLLGQVPFPAPAIGSAQAKILPQAQPTWSASANISSSTKDSRQVALARGLEGTIYAVWEERNYWGSTTFLCSSRLLNGSWTSPKVFYAGEDPSLAVSPDGGVHLVYANAYNDNYEINYSTWITDNWSASVNVSNTEGLSVQPAVAIAGDGRPIVVWSETLDGQTSIYFGRQNGGLWSTYPVDASSDGRLPDVAVERSGRIWVAWQALEDGHYYIYAIDGDGGSWANYAQGISDGIDADATSVDLVGISSFGAFAAWRGINTGGSQIYYTHNLPGVYYWEPAVNVSQSAGSASNPALAVDEAGNIYLAWSEDTQLRYRQGKASEQTWSSTSSIASPAPGLGPGALIAVTGPEVHAAWDQAVSVDQHDIYYRAASMPSPSATPSPTPSRTPTASRTPTRTHTTTPLPRRLWLPGITRP